MSDDLSMDHLFLKKLTDFLEVNLENEQFGVNELAKDMGVSRSKLHRKLHALTGKSTSQFIREFRLEKAMDMLQNNVATASEIAYRVGFGSPTYFNTSFREYYGYPPGEVKYRNSLTDESELSLDDLDQNDTSETVVKKVPTAKKKVWQSNVFAILLGMVLIIALFSYLYYENPKKEVVTKTAEVVTKEKSIAVLPFKNLSDNQDNQYFADGMREDIINHLSKMQDVVVKSSQSSDRYGSSILSGSEIGEALGVNYIIDGSVQKYGKRIKIIVHLINALNDTHLWSKDFDREFEDIFNLEKEISIDIASELNLVLSPTELQQIGKIPTEHIEAYNLYLKGLHFLYQFSNESFELSEKYFKESIAIDPDFALPYSGLAEFFLYRGWPRVPESDYLLSKDYALKAISLDSGLAETHRVLGTIYIEYEWNWAAAKEEFLKALELDPNNPNANISYARYLMYVKGDLEQSREYINKASLLAPVSYYIYAISSECYLLSGDYGLALQEANKAKEINTDDLWGSWIVFLVYVKQGKDDAAVNELRRSWESNPLGQKNVEPMLAAYKKDGIDGVFRWINNLDVNFPNDEGTLHNAYWIAQKFAFLGEDDKAMEWLHIAFERKNSELYRMKYDKFFKDMHTNPAFLLLLEKMDLGNYENEIYSKN